MKLKKSEILYLIIMILFFFNAMYRLVTKWFDLFDFIIIVYLEVFFTILILNLKIKINFLNRFKNKLVYAFLFILFIFTVWCLVNLPYVMIFIGFKNQKQLFDIFAVINIVLITLMYLIFSQNDNKL